MICLRRICEKPQTGRSIVAALVAMVAVSFSPPVPTLAATAVPGSSGTDTSLALTASQVTLSGRGKFTDLKVTVNQTKNLSSQAISVTWTGAMPTNSRAKLFGEHFLQMFQCWGDDDGSNIENPGPPPEQCQQGAANGVFEGRPTLNALFDPNALTRFTGESPNPFKPFHAVDGTVVPVPFDPTYTTQPGIGGGSKYWINSFFNVITTNEIPGSRTLAGGNGGELFEVTTGLESSGLGCGQKVQKILDGSTKIPKCWLVIVPRGSAADENGKGFDLTSPFVNTSPLAPIPWMNRISVPLEFNPVDSSCPLAADQRRLAGNELVLAAVSSWQPVLCATPGLSPYAYSKVSDSRARQQLLSGVTGAAGMAVIGRPLELTTVDLQNPVVYAPLTLSGTVIGFNIERFPALSKDGNPVPPGLAALRGVRVAQLNLTPRLVAKLLSQSYRSQVEIGSVKPPTYAWSNENPIALSLDQDFLQFNAEFELLEVGFRKNMGGLVMPSPNSDAAQQMWEWVFADPEARAWLGGSPDPWGMKVNPNYSTLSTANPQGSSFGDPLPDSYPKSDPHCFQGPDVQVGTFITKPPPLCGLDWLPYTQSLRDSARSTRSAGDGAKTDVNSSAVSPDQVYKIDGPQPLGTRSILSITDTASAAQYGVQMARLSQAGDNTAARTFIAPDEAGLTAGVKALAPKGFPGFLEPNPGAVVPGAYPLTALTYGAVTPLTLDAAGRKEYAAFVDYAAGAGQERGNAYGQLPAGYQPLPDDLRIQARAAAAAIRELKAATPVVENDVTPSDTAVAGTSPELLTPVQPSGVQTVAPQVLQTPVTSATAIVRATPVPKAVPPSKTPVAKPIETVPTPAYQLASTRYALPFLVVVAILGALGALEITKRRLR